MRLIRSRILYAVLLATVLLYAAIVQSRDAELLVYGLVGLPILTLLYAIITALFVEITAVTTQESPEKGDVIMVKVYIRNRFILPIPYLTLYTTVDRDISYIPEEEFMAPQIALLPREKRKIELDVLCRKHGYFTAGATGFSVVDYLRLFRIYVPIKPNRILVYPALQAGGGMLLEGVPSEYGGSEIAGREGAETPDTQEIRPYRPGDPMNRIHHSLSSRGFGLYARERVREGSDYLTVIYHSADANRDELDLLAHLTSALLFDATEAGKKVRLITGCSQKSSPAEYTDYDTFSFQKAFLKISKACMERLPCSFPSLSLHSNAILEGKLIIFSAKADPALLTFASLASETGHAPVVLTTRKPPCSQDALASLGIELYIAGDEEGDPVWNLV
ncbi:MAG: DUF58 domain-containing protein [Clostridia bacterium]|nr:DUF58 domain-containing protein [Clostridia bacterium]